MSSKRADFKAKTRCHQIAEGLVLANRLLTSKNYAWKRKSRELSIHPGLSEKKALLLENTV